MTSRVEQVLADLGPAIVAGELPAGAILTVEAIEQRTRASRSGVREALARLVAIGLVRPRRRLGFEVCDETFWQPLSPDVARWTLATATGDDAIVELEQLRRLVEPSAARSAAEVASAEMRTRIATDAGSIWAAAARGDRDGFLEADAAMHRSVYAASGNRYLAALGALMVEMLPARAESGISLAEARAHLDLADAVMRRDADAAEQSARAIIFASPEF